MKEKLLKNYRNKIENHLTYFSCFFVELYFNFYYFSSFFLQFCKYCLFLDNFGQNK